MDNTFDIEKMNAVPGIYMIYNVGRKTVYIGQAQKLKQRMKDHMDSLYIRHKDNKNLQKEFELGGNTYWYRVLEILPLSQKEHMEKLLDEKESLYFQAAKAVPEFTQVHNEQDLEGRFFPDAETLAAAKKVILQKLEALDKPSMKISGQGDLDKLNRDILDKYPQGIIAEAEQKLAQMQGEGGKITLDTISIKKLYESGNLKHLLVGKMGDYIGEDLPQSFSDILAEKLAYTARYGKCLWTAAGADTDEANKFIAQYGFESELDGRPVRKVYALFPLTSASYDNAKYGDQPVTYYWIDPDGQRHSDTGPAGKVKKALVLDKFWLVKEEFPLYAFLNNYYRHTSPGYKDGKPRLNKELSAQNQLLVACITAKKEIEANEQLQEALGFNKEMLKDLQDVIPKEEVPFEDNGGAVSYILAEALAYVEIRSDI